MSSRPSSPTATAGHSPSAKKKRKGSTSSPAKSAKAAKTAASTSDDPNADQAATLAPQSPPPPHASSAPDAAADTTVKVEQSPRRSSSPAPPLPGQPAVDPDAPNKQPSQQEEAEDWEAREQDRLLPIANVTRIMKKTLPDNAKLSKEAKELIQECVSEFISFITSEASDRCQNEKRKTINAEDILWAMQQLSFDNHADTMRVYLERYREWQQAKTGKGKKGPAGEGSGDDPTSPTSDLGGAAAAADVSLDPAAQAAHAAAAAQMMQQQQEQFAQLMQQQSGGFPTQPFLPQPPPQQ